MTESEKKLMTLINELRREVEDLKRWKKQKEIQQITLPLDEASKNIINNI